MRNANNIFWSEIRGSSDTQVHKSSQTTEEKREPEVMRVLAFK